MRWLKFMKETRGFLKGKNNMEKQDMLENSGALGWFFGIDVQDEQMM